MARFYPLYVRRSDGKLEVVTKSKRKEVNQPTDEQLDQKPDKHGVSDYYREVSADESKHVDWRRKLGGMLARELDWKSNDAQLGNEHGYMLAVFPEHYRLYEHVKRTEKDGKTEVKNKTHAAGGNERQDAYLYGHPAGRKKRYRSPADFFPHLLWLCTDESGDPDNCGCKICSPDDLDDAPPAPRGRPKSEPLVKPEPGASMARQGSGQGGPKVKQEPGTPVQARRPSGSLVPTTLAPPKTADQHMDRQYHTFMYRAGELVWFKRGAAWGLGAVLRRWVTASNQYHYTVQPLSNPFQHPPAVTKSSDTEMRPWLAWSVPKYTNDGLNNLPEPPKYESADWQGMLEKRYGHGDMEVDGSIMAAKSVDASYTPFGRNQTSQPEHGVTETHYDGIFLGAEKVWTGDPLRLHTGSNPNTDILVLHSIVGRMTSAMQQVNIQLVGDVYQLQSVPHANPSVLTPASPSSNPQLPGRLTDDLAFRNGRSIPAKHVASFWKLKSAKQTFALNDIKGRWYEASLLLPILHPSAYEEAASKGEIQEASLWMNSRGDCVNSNRSANAPKISRQNIWKENRRLAFGRSIPSNAEIKDGVEAPLPDNVDPALDGVQASQSSMDIDPRFETADHTSSDEIVVSRPGDQGMVDAPAAEGPSFDELMNLDGMEDHAVGQEQSQIPGFGQEYASQQGQGYY